METITLSISAQTLHTIGAGLRELPYRVADPAIRELDAQVRSFMAAKNNEPIPTDKASAESGA